MQRQHAGAFCCVGSGWRRGPGVRRERGEPSTTPTREREAQRRPLLSEPHKRLSRQTMADRGEMAPGHLSKLTLELGRVSPERLRQRTSSIAHQAEDHSGHLPKSPTGLAMLEHSPAMAQADAAMDFYLGALGAGPYQNACVFFGIVALFTQELHYFLPEVVAVRPKFWCSGTNVSLGKQNPCLEPGTNNSCTSWEFNLRDRKVSIVSEWELVCGRAWWIERSSLTYTLGAIVGIILAGILSDRFGRRTSLLICLLPMSAAGLSLSMASSPYLYTVLRFCVAVFVTPIAVISTVLISEVVAPRDLAVYVMAIQLGNSGASMALGWLHRTSAGWRFVIVIAMMPVLLLFFQFGSTSESPRWLVRTRDYNRAQRILLGAARKNGLEAIRALNLWTKARGRLENLETTSPKMKPRPMYWLLWATWRWTTVILLTTWFTMGYVYYAVVLSYIRMTYVVFNFDVRGALGPPTLVLAYLLAETLGRRRSVAWALAATGITAMLAFYFAQLEDLMTVLALVGMGAINVAATQLPLLTLEQYPSALRAASYCSAMFAGQLGALAAPFVRRQAISIGAYWPLFMIGLTSLTCGCMLLALPATKFEGMMSAKEWDDDDQAAGHPPGHE